MLVSRADGERGAPTMVAGHTLIAQLAMCNLTTGVV